MPHRFGPDYSSKQKKPAAVVTPAGKPGMTLVELMIVLLVSIIVLGAAFSLYQVNARYHVAQDSLLEQMQNLRSALYSVARDVRMSGNGLGLMGAGRVHIYINDTAFSQTLGIAPGWFRYNSSSKPGVRAIFGRDGGTAGSDTLTIFRTEMESPQAVGSLAGTYDVGSDSALTLRELLKDGLLNDGDMIAVANGGTVVVLQAGDVNSAGGATSITLGPRFKPGSEPFGESFPEGSNVYRLRDVTLVTYFLDQDNNCLMANYYDFTDGRNKDNPYSETGGPVVLANDIEDFQVGYILNNQAGGNQLTNITVEHGLTDELLASGRWVRAVRLALVSKSQIKNETTAAGRPVSVFNRQPGGVADGYQRRVLSDTVYLRNY
ncbi:hypothetical protein C4J81_02785 [Deltaproteobacteria bacterium Smac51]|nr:hypothetical protein C4J81_02785 [Deltaproteobacteria bacterium Smac51]